MKRKTTRCRVCGEKTKIIGRLSKAKCEHCSEKLLGHHTMTCFIRCENCFSLKEMKAFGWKKTPCPSCGNILKHPATKSKGGRHDRGIENDAQISFVLPASDKQKIIELQKSFGTSIGAVARFITKIGLDEPQ